MLNFIGTGSAFNTNLGNNGAYIKEGNELFLIDCGSNTFERLLKWNILNGIEKINVLITHTHPDHVGSLGDLIFYAYYSIMPMFKPKVTLIYPEAINIIRLLDCMGVTCNLYDVAEIENDGAIYINTLVEKCGVTYIRPVQVVHVDELKCFGYILKVNGKRIYYSGDSNMIPQVILDMLKAHLIDYFYQDTCQEDYEGNVHLSLRKLTQLIEPEYRDKIYCMHFDKGFDYTMALELGFNLAPLPN